MKTFKQILHWCLFGLTFIWQILQNLVAICMIPFLGKLRLISYSKERFCFAIEGSKMSGGISLGNFAFLSPQSAKKETSIAHEQIGHSFDSLLMGPLYLFIIGIPSILHTFHKDCPCYYHFYTEKWANKHANLEVVYRKTGYCYLKFKD